MLGLVPEVAGIGDSGRRYTERAAVRARVAAGGDADETDEVAVQLALVAGSEGDGHLADRHALPEQLAGAMDTGVGKELVRRNANLGAKGADKVVLVEADMIGEVVESDLVAEPLEEVGASAPDSGAFLSDGV